MASQNQTGYFLVNGGSKGFGVVWASGPAAQSSNRVFLGNTVADVQRNYLHAASSVGMYGMDEIDPTNLVHDLVAHRNAWWKTTPGNAQPVSDFYNLALGVAGVPELSAIFSMADLEDVLADGSSGRVPEGAGTSGGGSQGANATEVDDATNPDGESGDGSNGRDSAKDSRGRDIAARAAATESTTGDGLSGIAGFLAFLTDPHTWIRFAELIGGIALILMGLKSLTGETTTNPVDLIPSSMRTAGAAAVMA